MLLDVIKQYSEIISEYDIEKFRTEASSYELLATITFLDDSVLHIKDYFFRDGSRKYAYHWQTEDGELKIRWDNARHWDSLDTFPHHKHVRNVNQVEVSEVRNLQSVLEQIQNIML